jgi:hypothetical protein
MITTNILFHPTCGGPDLIVEEDGRVHVDGLGYITRGWKADVDQWKDLIAVSASKYGVPEAWIAGFMLQESQGKPKACSPCQSTCCGSVAPGCCAYGLMQLIQPTGKHYGVTGEDLYDPDKNIDAGTKLLSELGAKHKWNPVAVAASYNHGSYNCFNGHSCSKPGLWSVNENCGYVEQVVRGINAAIEHGYSGTGSGSEAPGASGWKIAVAVLAAAVPVAMVYGITKMNVGHAAAARANPTKQRAPRCKHDWDVREYGGQGLDRVLVERRCLRCERKELFYKRTRSTKRV